MRFEPATPVGGPLFTIDMSDEVPTVAAPDVELLFAPFGSAVVLLTVAVFEIVDPDATDGLTFTTSVTVAEPPFAMVPSAQLTGEAALHVPCDGVADTNVVFGGMVSETVAPVAADGPLFETVIV